MSRTTMKNTLMDLLCDVVGSVFYSLGIYTFAKWRTLPPEVSPDWR
ncbi:MAG: hypothetical protein ACLR9K_04750 [Blautia sp.]